MRALAILGVIVAIAAPQSREPQPAQTGTGRIAGVVVDAKSQPVPRAIVRLTAAEIPNGRAVVTDEKGAFAFDRLPAGRFSLSASKPAYLTAAYGAVRPGGAGTPLVLTPGAQLTDVRLTMPHGGAIAGVIRDASGSPVPAIQVFAVRLDVPTPAPPVRADGIYTDDRGAYRIFGLLPGVYVVYTEAGSSGGIGDVGMMTGAEIDATFARLKTRTATPQLAPSTERTPSSIVRPSRAFNPAPIFYPGATSVAGATPINLALGESHENVDFVYQLARTAAVSGTLSGTGTQNVSLSLSPEGALPTAQVLFGGPMLQRRPAGDGEFMFTGVTPGKYKLMARVLPMAPARGAPALPAPTFLFASASVEVTGDDISGIALVMQPALHVSGRVTFQGATQPTPGTLTQLFVRLIPASDTGNAGTLRSGATPLIGTVGTVQPDGSFEIPGVFPGQYRLAMPRPPAGWLPKSATFSGRDRLDVPFEVSGDVSGIEVVLTDQHSQINGHLLHANGSPATGYFVIAFPADRTLWTAQSRRMQSVRPATDGGFQIDDLPAGDYYLAALTDADSADWQSEAFLAQVLPAALKLTLGDAERKTQDLRIGR